MILFDPSNLKLSNSKFEFNKLYSLSFFDLLNSYRFCVLITALIGCLYELLGASVILLRPIMCKGVNAKLDLARSLICMIFSFFFVINT